MLRELKCVLGATALLVGTASAATVPFTEHFALNASGWRDAAGAAPLTWFANGGPNGSSYASGPFSFLGQAPGDTPVILRAQGSAGASGGAFFGNYLADGADSLQLRVRHNAPLPLTFFVRLSRPANFPAAVAVAFQPVVPDTWSTLQFDLSADSPQFISFEGSTHATVFSNIGNLQIGVLAPAGLPATPFEFDIDQVTLGGGGVPTVPALGPWSIGLLTCALLGGVIVLRRKASIAA